MQGSVVAERYASALFEVSKKKGLQDEIDAHLALAKGLFDDRAFTRLLGSPKILIDVKMEILRKGLEGVVDPLVLRLFELLLIRKRISQLPEISTSFTRLLEESKNIVRAQVRTAVPLGAEIEKKLQESLEGITGKKILIEKVVDDNLIGGVLVKMGDQLLDSTIRTRLGDMKEALLAVRVH
jgi:F-type H+-transporting ATPase subunit delta